MSVVCVYLFFLGESFSHSIPQLRCYRMIQLCRVSDRVVTVAVDFRHGRPLYAQLRISLVVGSLVNNDEK